MNDPAIQRPDPRLPASWCHEGVAHDHRACGTLWDSTSRRDAEEAARWADDHPNGAGRGEKEILADWRKVRDDFAALDITTPEWAERSAEVAMRTASILNEASRLDPMPREITMFLVGVVVWQNEEHARHMRAVKP